jgi:DNA-binding transcriptional LysR family regulator
MPRIDYQSDALIRAQIEQWWGEHFAKPSRVDMHVAGLDSCHHMLKHGLGYAFVPYRLVAGDKNLHVLILRDAAGNELRRTSWMLYNEATADSATIKAFINFIKKYPFGVITGEER